VLSLFPLVTVRISLFFLGDRTEYSWQLGLFGLKRFELLTYLPSVILEHLLLLLDLSGDFISESDNSSTLIRVKVNVGI